MKTQRRQQEPTLIAQLTTIEAFARSDYQPQRLYVARLDLCKSRVTFYRGRFAHTARSIGSLVWDARRNRALGYLDLVGDRDLEDIETNACLIELLEADLRDKLLDLYAAKFPPYAREHIDRAAEHMRSSWLVGDQAKYGAPKTKPLHLVAELDAAE